MVVVSIAGEGCYQFASMSPLSEYCLPKPQSAWGGHLLMPELGGGVEDRDPPAIAAQLQETLLLSWQPGAPWYKSTALTRKWKPHREGVTSRNGLRTSSGVSPSLEAQGPVGKGTPKPPETQGMNEAQEVS